MNDAKGTVMVLNKHGERISVFDAELKFAGDICNPLLVRTNGLCYNPVRKHIMATVRGSHALLALDRDGKTVFTSNEQGTLGNQPGQFRFPGAIAVDVHGRVFVVDSSENSIEVFDRDYKHMSSVHELSETDSSTIRLDRPNAIAVNKSGTELYVSDVSSFILVLGIEIDGSIAFVRRIKQPDPHIISFTWY